MTDNQQVVTACLATLKTIKQSTTSLLTIRHLEILLYVYLHEGITRQDLHNYLPGLSETSLRRYVDQLGKAEWKINYKDSQGVQLDLIREEYGDDNRYKHIFLNQAGRTLVQLVVQKLLDGIEIAKN